jgi:sRNA-binding carbon storage regulator CsrA
MLILNSESGRDIIINDNIVIRNMGAELISLGFFVPNSYLVLRDSKYNWENISPEILRMLQAHDRRIAGKHNEGFLFNKGYWNIGKDKDK